MDWILISGSLVGEKTDLFSFRELSLTILMGGIALKKPFLLLFSNRHFQSFQPCFLTRPLFSLQDPLTHPNQAKEKEPEKHLHPVTQLSLPQDILPKIIEKTIGKTTWEDHLGRPLGKTTWEDHLGKLIGKS